MGLQLPILLIFLFHIHSSDSQITYFDPFIDQDGFVVFKLQGDVENVFIAGDWNNWANNANGKVTDPRFMFTALPGNVWQRREILSPSSYTFKYAINNGQTWVSLNDFPHDKDGNTVMFVGVNSVSKSPETISESHWSFNYVPISNGFSAAKFNIRSRMMDSFTNHIYKQMNSDLSSLTINLISSIDFSLLQNNIEISRLSYMDIYLKTINYVSESGIGYLTYAYQPPKSNTEIPIRFYFFCSFLQDQPNLMIVIQQPQSSFTVAPIISWNPSANVKPINNSSYSSNVGTIYVNSMQTSNPSVYLFSMDIGSPSNPSSPTSALNNEINWWTSWLSGTKYPNNALSPSQLSLYKQSLSILKMAQCREPNTSNMSPFGQILASLPPGEWNICWIRDGSYATLGLILSGHYTEAKMSLEFFLNANVGQYKNFVVNGTDYGVGVDYQISVCRYYGDGSEWSDGGSDPNIELDGFGLFLWTLETYVTTSSDYSFLQKYWPVIVQKIANVLVNITDNQLGIAQKDSSIWERHLNTNGEDGAKHFSYTTITSMKGLQSASKLASIMNQPDLAQLYSTQQKNIFNNFLKYQIDPSSNVMKDSMERTNINDYIDASVVEAINWGYISPSSSIATSTIKAFDQYLQMKTREFGS
eukprot:TRINITY_DN1424_c0_g1_i1.p1 TRINITY_DN1424_c0_g1~~TRINITY_DN1424_c0_g1_i1.p1  ORF type:complete len:644 (-),score=114.23 TRINITY_DN1424_c0_g1_i1:341-2272(-)